MLPTAVARKPLHTRTVTYNGYAREDGLWDIEGELRDVKCYDYERHNGPMKAGTPVHLMSVRVTLDETFLIHDVQTSMDTTPFGDCQPAGPVMQRLIGQRMGPGWRLAIDRAVGGVQGCSHMRELFFNLATAAFQTIPHHLERKRIAAGLPKIAGDKPPFYMGKCMAWDFDGPQVARVAPQFVGWAKAKSEQ